MITNVVVPNCLHHSGGGVPQTDLFANIMVPDFLQNGGTGVPPR